MSTAPAAIVPLSSLRRGARGRLHSITLPCEDCSQLNAMGLSDQCELRVCRTGEPCIVQVQATRLGIAAAMARRIFVSPSGAGAASE